MKMYRKKNETERGQFFYFNNLKNIFKLFDFYFSLKFRCLSVCNDSLDLLIFLSHIIL